MASPLTLSSSRILRVVRNGMSGTYKKNSAYLDTVKVESPSIVPVAHYLLPQSPLTLGLSFFYITGERLIIDVLPLASS